MLRPKDSLSKKMIASVVFVIVVVAGYSVGLSAAIAEIGRILGQEVLSVPAEELPEIHGKVAIASFEFQVPDILPTEMITAMLDSISVCSIMTGFALGAYIVAMALLYEPAKSKVRNIAFTLLGGISGAIVGSVIHTVKIAKITGIYEYDMIIVGTPVEEHLDLFMNLSSFYMDCTAFAGVMIAALVVILLKVLKARKEE